MAIPPELPYFGFSLLKGSGYYGITIIILAALIVTLTSALAQVLTEEKAKQIENLSQKVSKLEADISKFQTENSRLSNQVQSIGKSYSDWFIEWNRHFWTGDEKGDQ